MWLHHHVGGDRDKLGQRGRYAQYHIGSHCESEREGLACFDLSFSEVTLATLWVMHPMLEGKIVQTSS